uniref:serine hydrolase n=1 Tax=uncultured Draconibacterium sp. TaxID=1573823 RepID=UPI003217060F
MTIYKLILSMLLIGLLGENIYAISNKNEAKQNQIEKLVRYCSSNDIFSGVILVYSEGDVIFKKAVGFKDYSRKHRLDTNSVFSLASVSKTFTSTAALLLIERGILKYDDKLSKFYPDFPNAEKITVYQLLTHTCGMPTYLDYGGVFRVSGRPGDFQDGVTNEKVLKYLKTRKTLRFQPGSRYQYSNSGYFMLSMVVEKASGKPFHKFIQEEIFTPLNMNDSYVASSPNLSFTNRARGFTHFYEPDDDNLLTTGGGGIFSTVDDLLKWDKALLSNTLLSKETFSQTFHATKLNDGSKPCEPSDSSFCYGKGWIYRVNANDTIMFHDGGLNCCSSIFYRDVKRKYTIIILNNKGNSGPNHPIYGIHNAIIRIMDDESFEYPKIPISIKVKKELELGTNIERAEFLLNNNSYDYSFRHLNNLGYHYLQKKETQKAQTVFRVNIKLHPNEANAYDSYAEALYLNNEFNESKLNYMKSLELNPDNTNASRMLKQIENKESKHFNEKN